MEIKKGEKILWINSNNQELFYGLELQHIQQVQIIFIIILEIFYM